MAVAVAEEVKVAVARVAAARVATAATAAKEVAAARHKQAECLRVQRWSLSNR